MDDTSTVLINDKLSLRAESWCCKSAFSALFEKQNCNKLLPNYGAAKVLFRPSDPELNCGLGWPPPLPGPLP
jgi:hypothetical protein